MSNYIQLIRTIVVFVILKTIVKVKIKNQFCIIRIIRNISNVLSGQSNLNRMIKVFVSVLTIIIVVSIRFAWIIAPHDFGKNCNRVTNKEKLCNAIEMAERLTLKCSLVKTCQRRDSNLDSGLWTLDSRGLALQICQRENTKNVNELTG